VRKFQKTEIRPVNVTLRNPVTPQIMALGEICSIHFVENSMLNKFVESNFLSIIDIL